MRPKESCNHTSSPRRPFRGFRLVLEEDIIVTNRVAGPAKKMKCAVKQVAGKALDDAMLEP